MRIENEFLAVETNPKGGCLHSIYDKKRNVELLYQPVENGWQGQDVFIFPFIARLVGGKYTHQGKEYEFKNHGLIRYMMGEEKMINGDIVISFHSNEETQTRYPFQWSAKAYYHLENKSLTVRYEIQNLSSVDMPFMVGGHPAFKVPGEKKDNYFDISGNYITFDHKMKLRRLLQEETFSFNIEEIPYLDTDRIDISKELFNEINTIILLGKDIDKITLHKTDGSILSLYSNHSDYLALWSDRQWSDYLAIEPWNGIPDYVQPEREISKKKGIHILPPNDIYNFSYKIEVDN